jgi:hypothetical protein
MSIDSEIAFIVEDEGRPIPFTYNKEKTIEDFLNYFVKNYTVYATLKDDVYQFKLGNKLLNIRTGLFLKLKIRDLLENGSRIVLSRSNELSYTIFF